MSEKKNEGGLHSGTLVVSQVTFEAKSSIFLSLSSF